MRYTLDLTSSILTTEVALLEIFVIVLALAFLQVWGSQNPLHRDQWFRLWRGKVLAIEPKPKASDSSDATDQAADAEESSADEQVEPTVIAEWRSFFVIALPMLALVCVFEFLLDHSVWLSLPVAVLVLLYSFGRGEFGEIVREYTQACYVEDWSSAIDRAKRFGVSVDTIDDSDWVTLHRHVFDEACYRGFERMFAVLFWFLVLGPVGGLMYRLVFLQANSDARDTLAQRWLWLIEWPAVRLMGFSFALTGNFAGCFERWRECLICAKRSTIEILSPIVLAALLVSSDVEPDCEITRKELDLMAKLYQRTLWFWVALASIVVIIL